MATIVPRSYPNGATRYQARIRRKSLPTMSHIFDTEEDAQCWANSVESMLQDTKHVITADQWRLLSLLTKQRKQDPASLIDEAVTHFLNEAIQRGEMV